MLTAGGEDAIQLTSLMSRVRQLEFNLKGLFRVLGAGDYLKASFFIRNILRAMHPVLGR